ncbi:hypothetical protein [Streptomyces sp. NPDC003077]|uniref:hypothetical protein n=1 Tax=Streptomyces sp. NPDC003077 TaxID=3154443 RepID=UPI0033B56AFE
MSTEDTPSATSGETTAEDIHEPAARHRRSTLVVASMAAAVLLAGGGVAYWSAGADGPPDRAGAPAKGGPPPLALAGQTRQEGTSPGIAPGEPNPQAPAYRATVALPTGPGSAPVYRTRGEVPRDAVARLAEALGMSGPVWSDGGTWRVGGAERDPRGPDLRVTKTGTGAWTYARYGALGGEGCTPYAMPGNAGGKSAEPGSPSGQRAERHATEEKGKDRAGQATPPDGTRTAPVCPHRADADASGRNAVSPDAAKRAARPVLEALGQRDARLDASGLSGAVRVVMADPVLGGLPTYGHSTDLRIGADGNVVGGSGQLAQPVKGPGYPVLNATRTLALMNKNVTARGGIGGCATAVPQTEDDATGPRDIPPCGPAAPEPSEVTRAVFGLAAQYVDGGPALVPSWLFTVRRPDAGSGPDATGTVAYPAVDPRYVVRANGGSPAPGGEDTVTATAQPPTKPTAVDLDSYSLGDGGRTLKLHFWGGVCSVYTASARQSDASVRAGVTGRDEKPGQVCVKIAREFTRTVKLSEPLADREVIDASTGRELPKR